MNITPELARADIGSISAWLGDYKVAGDVGQVRYGGDVHLTRKGMWGHVAGRIEGRGEMAGLAMEFAGRLVVAYGPKDKIEIGAYRESGNDLRGLWVPPGASADDLTGCGIELSRRESNDAWNIHNAIAIDGSTYTGRLRIVRIHTDRGVSFVQLTWELGQERFTSFGIWTDNALYTTFSFEPEKLYGVEVLERDGEHLEGHWIDSTGKTGTLRWMR